MQREVARNTIVELGYIGAHGVRLYDLNNFNLQGVGQEYLGRRVKRRILKVLISSKTTSTSGDKAHSMRNARAGSMEAARRAGMMPAIAAATVSTPIAMVMTGAFTLAIS